MNIDLPAAAAFMATHARVLDRRRFQLLLKESEPSAVLAALDAYRNPDGCGLEPDLRSPPSQPAAALHAFEVFEDALATTPRAVELCDWLASVSLPDGGLPFALSLTDAAGCAPFWVHADPTLSSLQITAVVAATAQRVAAHDPAVAGGHSFKYSSALEVKTHPSPRAVPVAKKFGEARWARLKRPEHLADERATTLRTLRGYDGVRQRTHNRPKPSGRSSPVRGAEPDRIRGVAPRRGGDFVNSGGEVDEMVTSAHDTTDPDEQDHHPAAHPRGQCTLTVTPFRVSPAGHL